MSGSLGAWCLRLPQTNTNRSLGLRSSSVSSARLTIDRSSEFHAALLGQPPATVGGSLVRDLPDAVDPQQIVEVEPFIGPALETEVDRGGARPPASLR